MLPFVIGTGLDAADGFHIRLPLAIGKVMGLNWRPGLPFDLLPQSFGTL
jgi:hypothetical protein